MKAIKISSNTKILSAFFWLIILLTTLVACDVTEADPDVLEPKTDLIMKEVHVMSGSTSVIDLNALIQTNQPVRLTLTLSTRKGQLTDLGKGLLQYVPAATNKKTTDAFQFTVFSLANEIIKTDSVVIVVENDSTQLPCSIFPVDDYVSVAAGATVIIDVLANDYFCAVDSASVVLTLYSPEPGFPPYFGEAEVVDNKIYYTPGTLFTNADKLIYKLQGSDGTVAYGFVIISTPPSCTISLTDDYFGFSGDSLDTSTPFFLPVFVNDILCDSAINTFQVRISKFPSAGEAWIDSLNNGRKGIFYQLENLLPGKVHRDSLRYEICSNAVCLQASVIIEIKN